MTVRVSIAKALVRAAEAIINTAEDFLSSEARKAYRALDNALTQAQTAAFNARQRATVLEQRAAASFQSGQTALNEKLADHSHLIQTSDA